MNNENAFPSLVQYFFTQHLCVHKHVSPQTVAAYRDTFRLLLEFLQARRGRVPTSLQVSDLDAPVILDFLEHLESDRGNKARSRNARLCAIKSFFHIVGVRDPSNMALVNRLLAIPTKRTTRSLITYLTQEEINAILAVPDQTTWLGARDHALLLTLYNTGARVSEVTNLLCGHFTFEHQHTFVHLHGKGRKDRTVPLWKETAKVLQTWFRNLESKPESIAFPNVHRGQLAVDSVDYLLQKAVKEAGKSCASLQKKRVTPHVMRHASAYYTTFQSSFILKAIALDQAQSTAVYGRNGRLALAPARLATPGPSCR